MYSLQNAIWTSRFSKEVTWSWQIPILLDIAWKSHVIACRIAYQVIANQFFAYRVIAYQVFAYRVIAYRVIAYQVIAYRVIAYRVIAISGFCHIGFLFNIARIFVILGYCISGLLHTGFLHVRFLFMMARVFVYRVIDIGFLTIGLLKSGFDLES
jgi:hypothetical protein